TRTRAGPWAAHARARQPPPALAHARWARALARWAPASALARWAPASAHARWAPAPRAARGLLPGPARALRGTRGFPVQSPARCRAGAWGPARSARPGR